MHLSALCKQRLPADACQKIIVGSKIRRVMKLTVILLVGACLQVSASGYSQKISLSARNASLASIFREIKNQTSYLFFYDEDVLKKARPIDIKVRNANLDEVLKI